VKFSIAHGGGLLDRFDGALSCSCGGPLVTISGLFENNMTTYNRIAAAE